MRVIACDRKSAPAGKRSAQQVPPEPRELRGHGGERPCSSMARASRAFPRQRRAAGDVAGKGGRSGGTVADSRRRHARWEGKWSGRFRAAARARRRRSRSRTRRGASEARRGRGGLRAERHTRERRERRHAPPAERACGGTACPIAHRSAKRAHALRARGSCTAAVRGLRTASVGKAVALARA